MSNYVEGLLENSPKFQVFFSILQKTVDAGDRLLLFSQSLGTLDLLEQFLSQRKVPGKLFYLVFRLNFNSQSLRYLLFHMILFGSKSKVIDPLNLQINKFIIL